MRFSIRVRSCTRYSRSLCTLLPSSSSGVGTCTIVMSLAGDALPKFDVSALLIGPLENLPDFSKLRTKINGGDGKGYAVAFWGNQTGLAYDPTRVDETKLPQTFDELSAWIKANPQTFAFNDPRGGGAGNAFLQAVVRNTVTETNLTADNYQAAWDWCKRRLRPIGLGVF